MYISNLIGLVRTFGVMRRCSMLSGFSKVNIIEACLFKNRYNRDSHEDRRAAVERAENGANWIRNTFLVSFRFVEHANSDCNSNNTKTM